MNQSNDGEAGNNDDETVENVNVEKEVAGLIDIFNEQKERQETKNVLTTDNTEATAEKKGGSSRRYKKKMQELQMYKSTLRRVMDTIEDPSNNTEVQNSCRRKMEIVYGMIENPTAESRPLKYEFLLKLEAILKTIASRVKVKKRGGSPAPLNEDEDDSLPSNNKHQSYTKQKVDNYSSKLKSSGLKKDSSEYSRVTTKATISKKDKGDKKSDEVLIGTAPSSSKTSLNKKYSSSKHHNLDNFEPLFTPDRNVSRIRPDPSQDSRYYSRSITESGTSRTRFQYSGSEAARPTHSFSHGGERYRANYGDRFRAPFPNTGERFRAISSYNGGRYRVPFSDRHRAPFSSGDRLRAPFSYSGEMPPCPPPSTKYFDKAEADTTGPPRSRQYDRSAISTNNTSSKSADDSRLYEKSKSITSTSSTSSKSRKDTKSHERRTSSSSSKFSNERYHENPEADSIELSTERYIKRNPIASSSFSSSNVKLEACPLAEPQAASKKKIKSLMFSNNLQPNLSSNNILEGLGDVKMQQKDLDKLQESRRQLQSNLNKRFQNMRMLQASLNREATVTSKEAVEKKTEELGVDGDNKEKLPNKLQNFKSIEEISPELPNEGDPFINKVMSNLTSKFGPKRCPINSHEQQEKSKDKVEKCISNRPNVVETLESNIQDKSCQETHFQTPIFTEDDIADVCKTVKQLLAEQNIFVKSTPAMNSNSERETSSSVGDVDPLNIYMTKFNLKENMHPETISKDILATSNSKEGLQLGTITNVTNAMDTTIIPGLDGIIPPALERSTNSCEESVSDKTKDHCLVSVGLKDKGNQSSQKSPVNNLNPANSVQGGWIGVAKVESTINKNVDGVNQNQNCSSNLNEDLSKLKQNQSVRSKLTGDITTLHKVGTPCGGALRGLVKRDKMMPSGQIASLKTGTLYDLIGEDKPRSAHKPKTKPQLQQNSSNDVHGNSNISSDPLSLKPPVYPNEVENPGTSIKTKSPNDILSKLSQNDLQKIVTENIGVLPNPPNLPFLPNAVSSHTNDVKVNSSNQGFTWNNQTNSLQQVNVQTQNVVINNINVPSVDSTCNNGLLNQQIISNWGPSDVNDVWENNITTESQWREANQRSLYYLNSYNPPLMQMPDSYTSSGYDGSKTPDPYTMNLRGSFENNAKLSSDSTKLSNVYSTPSLLGDPPSTFDRLPESHNNFAREVPQRPPLLRTPPLSLQRHSLIATQSLTQEGELYSNFSANQHTHFNDPRNIRRAGITYGEWKAEKDMVECRKFNQYQSSEGPVYHSDRTADDQRNFNRYRWSSDTYENRNRDCNSRQVEALNRTHQKEIETVKKLSSRDPRRKSIEDNSERKESLQTSTLFLKTDRNINDWSSKNSVHLNNGTGVLRNIAKSNPAIDLSSGERPMSRDPRTRERTPPKGRSRSRDQRERTPPRGRSDGLDQRNKSPSRRRSASQTKRDWMPPRGRSASRDHNHYGSRDRSLSRGRRRSPNRGSSPSKRSDNFTNKHHRNETCKDTYSSPLDQLYTRTSDPKTGLGYGLQKYRIPRWNKNSTDYSAKYNSKKTACGKDSSDSNKKYFNRDFDTKKVVNDARPSECAERNISVSDKCKDEQIHLKERENEIQDLKSDIDEYKDDCQLEVKQISQNQEAEKIIESKHNTRSRNKEATLCSDAADSLGEEMEQSLCRRSSRLSTKKRDGPKTNKSPKKEIEFEKKSRASYTKQCKSDNENIGETDVISINKSTELLSSDKNSNKRTVKEEGSNDLKEVQTAPQESKKSNTDENISFVNDESQLKSSCKISKTKIEPQCSEVMGTKTGHEQFATIADSISSERVQPPKSTIIKSEEIPTVCRPSTKCVLSSEITIQNHESSNSDRSCVHSPPPKVDTRGNNTNEDTPDLSKKSENEKIVDPFVKENSDDIPPSRGSDVQKLIKSETISKSSVTKTEARQDTTLNPCDGVNKDPEIKIIKHAELLEDVMGIKLTPDKIRKMIEIFNEDKDVKPQQNEMNEATKPVQVLVSDVITEDSNERNNKTSGLGKEEFADEQTVVKDNKESEVISTSDTNDGKETHVPPTKAKVLKKRRKSKLKPEVPKKEDHVNKTTTQKPKRKYKNELDRLQDDISKYHDSEAIAAASGPRQCRLQKEKDQLIGKMPQSTPSQNVKKKGRKCKEDEFDDLEEGSIEEECNKSKDDEDEEVSIKEESDEEIEEEEEEEEEEDSTEEELTENKCCETDSSDEEAIHLYTEKIKSKYGFVLEEESRGERSGGGSCEINIGKSKGNSEVESLKSSINKIDPEHTKPVPNEDNISHDKTVKVKSACTLQSDNSIQTDVGVKTNNVKAKNSNENGDPCNQSTESCSDLKPNLENEESPKKILSNHILHKNGMKKQRKKSFWSAGIIRKKAKSKKTESPVLSANEDNVDSCDMDEGEETAYAPDVNYYQEGDSKTMKCKLCPYQGKSIVSHYAITHPKDEVLISRMSPKAAEIAIKESGQFFSLSDEKKKDYSSTFECRICYLKTCKFSIFFEHMALHTGEFRHECCKCGYRTTTKSGITKHSLMHSKSFKNNRILYKEPANKAFFSGYLCLICNYFQISQKNVRRHVESVHETQDVNNLMKINFSKVTVSESDLNISSSNINSGSETFGEVKHIQESATKNSATETPVPPDNQPVMCSNILEVNNSSHMVEEVNINHHLKANKKQGGELQDQQMSGLMNSCISSVGDATSPDLNDSNKDAQDITGVKKTSSSSAVALTCEDVEDANLNIEQNTTVLKEMLNSNVVAATAKDSEVSTLNSFTEDTSGMKTSGIDISMKKDAKESSLEKELQGTTTDLKKSCVGASTSSGNNILDPEKEENQEEAHTFLHADWFPSLCEKVAEINRTFLIENANASILAKINNMKLKTSSSNLLDELSHRCTVTEEDNLALDNLLTSNLFFKAKEDRNVSCDNFNESIAQENLGSDEETLPPRRQLPDRTCKGVFVKPKIDDNERENEFSCDVEDEVEIFMIVKNSGEHENNWNDEVIVKEEFVPNEEYQPLPCLSDTVKNYQSKVATRGPIEFQEKLYMSSLPPNSNFSEFTHVMKQISQVSLKVSDIKEVTVGGLKALPADCGVIFSCSIKIFNKECEFQTTDLEHFGQHVNMSHHTSHWTGVCVICRVQFVRDINSHDKVSVNTQSKAFCHLVREHLTFTKKTTKSASRGNLTLNEAPVPEEPPQPRLRVRRLSGDMLSAGTENSLPQPTVTVTGPGETRSSAEDRPNCSAASHAAPEQSTIINHQAVIPTEEEISRGLKVFKPYSDAKGANTIYKMEKIYKTMCSELKLQRLYKCMGACCSFSTTALKDFARHFEEHKDIYLLDPDGDPHKGFWNACAYCLAPHNTSKDLCIHIRKEHGVCTMQCFYCFYRAKSIANVHFHHTIEHANQRFQVLMCEQTEMNLPPLVEKPFTDFVSAFRCTLTDRCYVFTYMLHTFCNHLKSTHPNDLRCHLCMESYPGIKILLQHYSQKHGIGLYQCLFCTYGVNSEHDIRLHLCYSHPNTDPKALQRTDSNNRPVGQPPLGSSNKESIKRLMFYKDQDKLMKYVKEALPDCQSVTDIAVASAVCQEPNVVPIKPLLESTISSPIPSTSQTGSSFSVFCPEINDRALIQQTPTATTSLDLPTISPRPTIMRTKRPAGETSETPRKFFLVSGPKISNEGIKTPVRITPISPSKVVAPTKNVAVPHLSGTDEILPVISKVVSSNTTFTAMDVEKSSSSTDRNTLTPERSEKVANSDDNNGLNISEDTNYFKCGNKGCTFEVNASALLRNHLVICDQARQCQKLSCSFCNRVFKQVTSFVEHMRTHGPERYKCSICPFKASTVPRVNSHMKTCHQVFTTNVVPVDATKTNPEKDYFLVSGKVKKGRGAEKPGPKGKAKSERKTKFSPEELEDVPKAAIFQVPLGCRVCSYETKVRSNLVRHIQQHTSGNIVPQEEVVNPVPEKTEKMFDKMMNLAGSSHKKKQVEEKLKDDTPVMCMYKYVPDQVRYMCHVTECGYRTLTEAMLRDHIAVIHKDETYYVCPHCIEEVDVVPIPVDQLSMHLKLHDSPVFKCAYCHFCSHIRRSIERHTEILHPGEPVDVKAVRLTKPDQKSDEPVTKSFSADKFEEQGEEWYCCNNCIFKTKKKKVMLQHGIIEHKISKPFKCSSCKYESLTDHMFTEHFNTNHPDGDCQLIALYKKVTEVKKPVLPPIPPLWKRDAKRLKLIRGIRLDEKGDAPPPVATATTGIEGLDVLELKFGHFGKPLGMHYMCPRCATTFTCKNQQEMKEHLFKDLQYNPILCKICKMGSTQRTKIMKHVNKTHSIEWHEISEYLDINTNEELELWVEKVLTRQQSLMVELPHPPAAAAGSAEPVRKRRRSSAEALGASPVPALVLTPEPPTIPVTVEQISIVDSEDLPISQETTSAPGTDGDELKGREKRKRDKCPSRHRFKCGYCELTTKFKQSMIVHSRKIHPDLPPKVNILDKTIDENMEAFNCTLCNCIALNFNNMKHHWTHKHKTSGVTFSFKNTVFNTEIEYECYWCKKRGDIESLEEHCKDDHSPDQRFLVLSVYVPKYKCSECKLVFNSMDILKRHFAMDHPSKEFCFIVVNTPKPLPSSNKSSSSSNSLLKTSRQSNIQGLTYKCFNCNFVSSQFQSMMRHVHRHFVTFVCTECDSLFPTALGLKNHMSKHPLSSVKPQILKGSERDIENAKKNIMVILDTGIPRKITEQELADAEKEVKGKDDHEFTYDDPLEVQLSPPAVKETARKSTGSPKYNSSPPRLPASPLLQEIKKLPSGPKKVLFKNKRKNLKSMNTSVSVKCHNRVLRFPLETFRKLINCDGESLLKTQVM